MQLANVVYAQNAIANAPNPVSRQSSNHASEEAEPVRSCVQLYEEQRYIYRSTCTGLETSLLSSAVATYHSRLSSADVARAWVQLRCPNPGTTLDCSPTSKPWRRPDNLGHWDLQQRPPRRSQRQISGFRAGSSQLSNISDWHGVDQQAEDRPAAVYDLAARTGSQSPPPQRFSRA